MKFSIRDLLLVTVIVALAVGWWLDRTHMREEVRRSNNEEAAATEALAEIQAALLKLEIQVALVKSMGQAYSVPPKSQAPTANPPKP